MIGDPDVECYDSKTNEWKTLAPTIGKYQRYSLRLNVINGELYFIGQCSKTTRYGLPDTESKIWSIEKYDRQANAWIMVCNFISTFRIRFIQ